MHSNIVRRALKILVAADKLSVDNSYFTTINKYYDHILAQPEQLGLLPKKDTDDEDDRYIDVAALWRTELYCCGQIGHFQLQKHVSSRLWDALTSMPSL